MNTFGWKISNHIVEQTSILHIQNALSKSQCVDIKNQILNFKEISSQQQIESNDINDKLCWRGYPHVSSDGFNDTTNELIKNVILSAYDKFKQSIPYPDGISVRGKNLYSFDTSSPLMHLWANVNQQGGYNIIHNHSGSLLSGVIYIQCQGTGFVEFYPANYLNKINHPLWLYNGTRKIDPLEGDLIIFPSYLMHFVEPNPSKLSRINLAFNLTYDIQYDH